MKATDIVAEMAEGVEEDPVETMRIGGSVPKESAELFKAFCKETKVKPNDALTEAIGDFLEGYEPEEIEDAED